MSASGIPIRRPPRRVQVLFDAHQIDWLAALMGMDSMPALMLIVAEKQIAVIFAHERAQQRTLGLTA